MQPVQMVEEVYRDHYNTSSTDLLRGPSFFKLKGSSNSLWFILHLGSAMVWV